MKRTRTKFIWHLKNGQSLWGFTQKEFFEMGYKQTDIQNIEYRNRFLTYSERAWLGIFPDGKHTNNDSIKAF